MNDEFGNTIIEEKDEFGNAVIDHGPEAQKGLFRRGLEWVGRQASRVPAAIRGGVQAYQENNPYEAADMAWRGLKDPESVQSSPEMMANFGADTAPRMHVSQPPPDAEIMARNMNYIPGVAPKTTPDTTYYSDAQGMGTAFDNLAPTGLEFLPVVKAAAGFLSKGAVKAAAHGAAGTVDALRGGTAAADAIEGAKRGVEAYRTRQAAKLNEVFNPQYAPDAEAYKKVGSSLGFTPEEVKHPAIEFGELSVPARRNKALAQGEGGAPYLDRHNAITEKIQRGFDQAVESIGGRPLEPVQAGELIRQGVKNGAKRIAESVTASHGSIIDQFPALAVTGEEAQGLISKLNGVEKFAKGRAMRGVVPEQRAAAESIINSIDAIRNSNMSYKQLNEAREMIGDVAFDDVGAVGKIPAYQQKMRDLYFSINDALIGTVGKLDRVRKGQFRAPGTSFEPIKEQLIESNKTLHEMFQDESAVGRALGNAQKAPEEIFNQALLYGDTRKAKALRGLLTPEEFNQAKGAYINALVKRGKDNFTYKSAKNTLAQNRSMVNELFADAPTQVGRLKEIIDLGDRVGAPLFPGSAGQLDFGGANSLAKTVLHQITAPVGDVTAEIGKVRAARGAPVTEMRGADFLPVNQALKLARPEAPQLPWMQSDRQDAPQNMDELASWIKESAIPPHLRRGR